VKSHFGSLSAENILSISGLSSSYSEKYFSHVERPLFFPEGHEPAICDSSPYPFKRTEPEYPHPEMTQNHLYKENGQYNGGEPYGNNPVEHNQNIEKPRPQHA